MCTLRSVWVALFTALISIAGTVPMAELSAQQPRDNLGSLVFPTSAKDPAAQRQFETGMLLMHSFEYVDARSAFQRARELEPELAIAAWGEAMTHWHPIWNREDLAASRSALQSLAASEAQRRDLAGTDLERGLLQCAEILFRKGDRAERWAQHCQALGQLSARHPYNVEVGALHCLATLSTSGRNRDTRIYVQAAAIGEHYYRMAPRHPGLLHYLIHSYDDPVHAPLGLRMARVYDKVAPDAAHALHMPSHIYLALGMWPETVAANIRSSAAADARIRRLGLGVGKRGWHSLLWLAYGQMQLGQQEAASAVLDQAVEAFKEQPDNQRIRYHLCHMRALYALDTGDWGHPAVALDVPLDGIRGGVLSMEHWFRGMRMLRSGNHKGVEDLLQQLEAPGRRAAPSLEGARGSKIQPSEEVSCCAAPSGPEPTPRDRNIARITVLLLRGEWMLARGNVTGAGRNFRDAAQEERTLGLDYGPPHSIPAAERLAAFQLTQADAKGADALWEEALRRAPGRRTPTVGLAKDRKDPAGN